MTTFGERAQSEKFGLDKPDPHRPQTKTKSVLTIDEVMELVSEIAQNGEGADRFRALKMLASSTGSTINLPEPLIGGEVINRLARMMKAAGRDICEIAFTRAYPFAKKKISQVQLNEEHLDPKMSERVKRITSLKLLYREFPEIKRHGVPKGYPTGRGPELQLEWLRRKATLLLIDRARKDRELMNEENKDVVGTGEQSPDIEPDALGTEDTTGQEPDSPPLA